MTDPNLQTLFSPRSVAVVGASERSDAIGTRLIRNLRTMGFDGSIFPVNPRYPSLAGETCYPSLADLPEKVDAAFLAVPAEGGPDLLDQAAKAGIHAVFLNANGYADGDAHGKGLQRRLTAIARENGMAVCGPNNLGLINVLDHTAMWTPRYFKPVRPGPVAVISQSGSIGIILADDDRELGFAYLVTTGNEAVLTVADYLNHLAKDNRVGLILLFLETVRDPELFSRGALAAVENGKRIIALKLGRSETGRSLVHAHTGSLAGEHRLYEAYLRALGIILVRDLDEMLETTVLLAHDRTAPKTKHFVPVTLSGGEAALMGDLGEEVGIRYRPLASATLQRLRPAFPPHSTIGNPLDAWGLGFSRDRFQMVLDGLLKDPDIGVLGFSVDAPGRGGADVPYACTMADACAAACTDVRMVFFNNISGTGVNGEVRAILDRARIPYLSGMRPALASIAQLLDLPAPVFADIPDAGDLPSDEPARFAALRSAGIPMVACETVRDADEAVAAAERIGLPVAMKGVAPHLPHKTELGLVRLGLCDRAGIAASYHDLHAALQRHSIGDARGAVVVQPMAPPGIELILGANNWPGFGSFLLVGPGGIRVEINRRAAVRRGPVNFETARSMLNETSAATLLGGVRGQPACDLDAVAAIVAAFSRFAASHRNVCAAIEINPLIVTPHGALGVDVLVEPFREESPG